MPLDPDQLPDDIAELKRRFIAQATELAATENGLVITQLTIEKLKAQIARLKRQKFGASSEKIERALEQLELALEEAEAAKAEAIAAQPRQPEPEAPPTPVPAGSAPAESEPATKKKRRQFAADFPRRDVVHRPSGVCKACGGAELRTLGETVTEVLSYVPARFEAIRHVRPACSCKKCETMVQMPSWRSHAPHASRYGRCELSRAYDRREILRPQSAFSPGRDRRAPASRSTAVSVRNGSATSPGYSAPSSSWLPRMSWPAASFMPTIHRSTSWRRAMAKPKRAGSGFILIPAVEPVD